MLDAPLRVSHTLSKSSDDVGNFFFSAPQDNSNLRGEDDSPCNTPPHGLIQGETRAGRA